MQVLVCNGYNLLLLTDDSPESFERVYRKEEADKEIERLSDLNKIKGFLIKAQAKEIGKLLKEKETLVNIFVKAFAVTTHGYERNQHVVYIHQDTYDEILKKLQALKGE